MTNFYYVYKVGGGKPTFHHSTFQQAVEEAQRLVDSVGGEYEILEARAIVKDAPKYVIEALNPSIWDSDGQLRAIRLEQDPDDFEPPF